MKNLLFLAVFAALGTSAIAQTGFVYDGDTTGDPVFRRPDTLTGFTFDNRQTRYEAREFQVSANGVYTGELRATFDPYLLVYQDSFDPNSPLTNLLNGDRRYAGAFTVIPGSVANQGISNRGARIFAGEPSDTNNEQFVRGAGLQLQAGRKYISVVTAFFNPGNPTAAFGAGTEGTYTVGIGGGPGNVTAFQAVPEPATMAALGFGALALLKRRRKG